MCHPGSLTLVVSQPRCSLLFSKGSDFSSNKQLFVLLLRSVVGLGPQHYWSGITLTQLDLLLLEQRGFLQERSVGFCKHSCLTACIIRASRVSPHPVYSGVCNKEKWLIITQWRSCLHMYDWVIAAT